MLCAIFQDDFYLLFEPEIQIWPRARHAFENVPAWNVTRNLLYFKIAEKLFILFFWEPWKEIDALLSAYLLTPGGHYLVRVTGEGGGESDT